MSHCLRYIFIGLITLGLSTILTTSKSHGTEIGDSNLFLPIQLNLEFINQPDEFILNIATFLEKECVTGIQTDSKIKILCSIPSEFDRQQNLRNLLNDSSQVELPNNWSLIHLYGLMIKPVQFISPTMELSQIIIDYLEQTERLKRLFAEADFGIWFHDRRSDFDTIAKPRIIAQLSSPLLATRLYNYLKIISCKENDQPCFAVRKMGRVQFNSEMTKFEGRLKGIEQELIKKQFYSETSNRNRNRIKKVLVISDRLSNLDLPKQTIAEREKLLNTVKEEIRKSKNINDTELMGILAAAISLHELRKLYVLPRLDTDGISSIDPSLGIQKNLQKSLEQIEIELNHAFETVTGALTEGEFL